MKNCTSCFTDSDDTTTLIRLLKVLPPEVRLQPTYSQPVSVCKKKQIWRNRYNEAVGRRGTRTEMSVRCSGIIIFPTDRLSAMLGQAIGVYRAQLEEYVDGTKGEKYITDLVKKDCSVAYRV